MLRSVADVMHTNPTPNGRLKSGQKVRQSLQLFPHHVAAPADNSTTPVQQVQPQGLLTQGSPFTPRGHGQAISPWTDRHESYSSDDEGVSFAQCMT